MGDFRLSDRQRTLTDEQRLLVQAMFAEVRAADRRGPDPGAGPGDNAQIRLAWVDDEIAGLTWRDGADPAELYVRPRLRRRGIGRALATAAVSAPGGIWAHGTLPAARRLADTLGLAPGRELLQLRRDLRGTRPEIAPHPPEGVTLRTFRPGQDDAQFLAVNGRAFAWHPEQGRLDQVGLDQEMTQPWFDADGFFLAVDDDDRVLGFHWTKVHPADPTPPADTTDPVLPADPSAAAPLPEPPATEPPATPPPIGEVYVIGVDPQSPVRGLGTPLTEVGLAYLAGRGLEHVMLYVEADNAAALKLYDRMGFSRYATDTVFG